MNIILALASGSMGLCLGCLFPNAEVAVALLPLVFVPLLLFGGFFLSLNSVPVWLSWIQYISIFKWSLQALIVNEFYTETFTCAPSEYIQVSTPEGIVQVCPVTNGLQVLTKNDYITTSFVSFWIAIGVMVGLWIFFRVAALLLLIYQTKRAVSKNQ